MMSNEEMVRRVFERSEEYFRKKEKRSARIKKGVSFMSLFSIITIAGFGMWSSGIQNPVVPEEPKEISIIETTVTSEASVVTTLAPTIETDSQTTTMVSFDTAQKQTTTVPSWTADTITARTSVTTSYAYVAEAENTSQLTTTPHTTDISISSALTETTDDRPTFVVPTIEITLDKLAELNNKVLLDISLTNNPGFCGLGMNIKHDKRLTLVSSKESGVLAAVEYGITQGISGNPYEEYYTFGIVVNPDPDTGETIYCAGDGVVWKIGYKVPEDAAVGDEYVVEILAEGNTDATELITRTDRISSTDIDYVAGKIVIVGDSNGTSTEPVQTTTTTTTTVTTICENDSVYPAIPALVTDTDKLNNNKFEKIAVGEDFITIELIRGIDYSYYTIQRNPDDSFIGYAWTHYDTDFCVVTADNEEALAAIQLPNGAEIIEATNEYLRNPTHSGAPIGTQLCIADLTDPYILVKNASPSDFYKQEGVKAIYETDEFSALRAVTYENSTFSLLTIFTSVTDRDLTLDDFSNIKEIVGITKIEGTDASNYAYHYPNQNYYKLQMECATENDHFEAWKKILEDELVDGAYMSFGLNDIIPPNSYRLTLVQNPYSELTPEIITGDTDGDGKISTSDAAQALSIYALSASGNNSKGYSEAADVDCDGTVSLNDAKAILAYYAQNAAGLNPTWESVLS